MERMILPDAAWRSRPGLDALCAALGAAEGAARFVGGAVRDTLIGSTVNDIDIATRLAPEAVLDRLAAARIRAVPTGLAHGTVTAVLPDGPVEVTTLRRDLATDGRHATVAFTDDWREDAARRDFTINALYADPASGALFDYFGGLDDLAAQRVCFIGDPLQRIAEDHLRILRFFRFSARFSADIDAAGLAACAARARDLMALSRERIASELLRLLVAPRALPVVTLMIDRDIFAAVLPEIARADRLARLVDREAEAGLDADPIRRLAALLPPDPQTGEAVGARLKLSTAQRKRLASALVPAQGAVQPLAYRLGREGAIDRWLLTTPSDADAVRGARDLVAWEVPRLPIGGGALVARGLTKGPDVARTLRGIEDQWIAEGFPSAERVAAIADAAVAQALRSTSSA
ncbi:MAG: polynucleotide adenylyltransferase [Sphingomonas sp. 28-66-16]|nr:MAG: polynucleotide adenylyltransferase [Sphingomonas sp. 28-66-16]